MSITSMLDNAKSSLADMKRKYKFKKANELRKDAAELQSALAKCRGQLEICQKEFKRTIKAQCKSIEEGKMMHADTRNSEGILWDAAIGYMLVKDAIYAIKSINSNDSIAHAYDMLDAAVEQMKGKRNRYLDLPHFKPLKKRSNYDYITSDEAVKEKEILLNGIFEKLKETGDIDACMEEAYNIDANGGFTGDFNELKDRLDAMSEEEEADFDQLKSFYSSDET